MRGKGSDWKMMTVTKKNRANQKEPMPAPNYDYYNIDVQCIQGQFLVINLS